MRMGLHKSWAFAVGIVASLAIPVVGTDKPQECGYESISINQILEVWPNHMPLLTRLVKEHGESGVVELVHVFGDRSKTTELRGKAMWILDEIGAAQTGDLVLEALAEKDLQCAAISLSGWYRNPQLVPRLVTFLDDHRVCGQEESVSTSSSEVKKTDWFASDGAVGALERITRLSFETNKDLFQIGHRAAKPWMDWWEKNRNEYRESPEKFLAPGQPKREAASEIRTYCSVEKIALSPDGSRVFSGSQVDHGGVRLWDLKTNEQLWVQQGQVNNVTGAAFSPDGKIIATSSWDGSVMVWDSTTGKRMRFFLLEDYAGADSVVFSPDGSLLAAADDHGLIRLWSTKDWCLVRELNNEDMTEGIAFSPDGEILAAATFEHAQIWNVGSGARVGSLAVRPAIRPKTLPDGWAISAQLWRMAWNVAFSPDGRFVVTGSSAAVQVWDISNGKEVEWTPSNGQVVGLTYSPDGQWIIWGNENDEIRAWNPKTRKTRRIKNFASFGDIVVTPDGQRVLSVGADKAIQIYDLQTGKQVGEIKCHE